MDTYCNKYTSCSCLSEWWLYKTSQNLNVMELVGITGGIIKMFQLVNNTISRVMLKILRKRIKKENQQIGRAKYVVVVKG